jgi:hypothetical protein
MIRILLSCIIGISLLGCETRKDREKREKEALEEKRSAVVETALNKYKGALDFENVEWGSPFTISKQDFLSKNPGQIFYATCYDTDLDVLASGKEIILTFFDFENNRFRLQCSREQISKLSASCSENSFKEFLIIFLVKDFHCPLLSLEADVESSDGNNPSSWIVVSDAKVTIASGKLVEIIEMP